MSLRLRRSARLGAALVALGAHLAVAPAAGAAAARLRIPVGDTPLEACPGDPIEPDRIVEGSFPEALEGAYVMLPFEVPPGTTSVRVKYCWEGGGHTVDLGLWQARPGKKPWGPAEFRGWGGSSTGRDDCAAGLLHRAEYLAAPKGHVAGRTTRASCRARSRRAPGRRSSASALWRTTTRTPPSTGASRSSSRTIPPSPRSRTCPPLRRDAARSEPGWYAGDMHVHAEHSALGDATMTETFDFAFRPLDEGGTGLDFITLSDYVTTSGWGEIGRYQALHPGKLVIRSSEVITYRGHSNNHASLRYVDHRLDRCTSSGTAAR